MKLRIPYLLATILATASILYLADTPGLSAAAPLVGFKTTEGHAVDLASPDGKVRLISFWSPNCPISQRNQPTLSDLQDRFASSDLDIIGIAMSYDDKLEIDTTVAKDNIRYQIAHDTNGRVSDAFPGVRFTPTTFLIDGKGEIVWRHVGKLNALTTESLVTNTLQPEVLAER